MRREIEVTPQHPCRGGSAVPVSPGHRSGTVIEIADRYMLMPAIPLILIFMSQPLLSGKIESLAAHVPPPEYSTQMPYSPQIGTIQATMGLMYIGTP